MVIFEFMMKKSIFCKNHGRLENWMVHILEKKSYFIENIAISTIIYEFIMMPRLYFFRKIFLCPKISAEVASEGCFNLSQNKMNIPGGPHPRAASFRLTALGKGVLLLSKSGVTIKGHQAMSPTHPMSARHNKSQTIIPGEITR